jgi:IS30 family transposase
LNISRELKRNTGQRGYRPKQAQMKAIQRRQSARKYIKMTPQLKGSIVATSMLLDKNARTSGSSSTMSTFMPPPDLRPDRVVL